MKKTIGILALVAFMLAPCLAQEAADSAPATTAELTSRIESLEETLDQMKRDKAEEGIQGLTQNLDWGKGWGIGANLGTVLNAPSAGLDISSPLFFKSLRLELTSCFWAEYRYPEPLSRPDAIYTLLGFSAGSRLSYYSPLLFNFTRLYGGLGAEYVYMIGVAMDQSSSPATKTDDFIARGLVFDSVFGVELYTDKKWCTYLELVPDWNPILAPLYWTSAEDKDFFGKIANAVPGSGSGVTLKCGLRFHF